jgi:glutathione peroxidase
MKTAPKFVTNIIFLFITIAVFLTACSTVPPTPKKTVLDFEIKGLAAEDVINLAKFKGNVVLIVNTATGCGLTPQFTGLEKLYEKYKDKGFVIIGFPSNSFRQEPKSEQEIKTFCTDNYLVTFPLTKTISVKGSDQYEVYKYLTDPATSPFPGVIKWNFEKFLISRNAQIINRFDPEITPEDSVLVNAVEKAVAEPVPAVKK